MSPNKFRSWQFICLVVAFVLVLILGIVMPFAYMYKELAWLQTPMLAAMGVSYLLVVVFSALALKRIGQPVLFAVSALFFPLIPIIIYAISRDKSVGT